MIVSREQMALLGEIQALEFTCLELNLYLDTHPGDECALADYNANVRQLMSLMGQYAQCYGPLMPCCHETAGCTWNWIYEPWPWEIEY